MEEGRWGSILYWHTFEKEFKGNSEKPCRSKVERISKESGEPLLEEENYSAIKMLLAEHRLVFENIIVFFSRGIIFLFSKKFIHLKCSFIMS